MAAVVAVMSVQPTSENLTVPQAAESGAAWAGEEDVAKVEISTDGGKTWGPVDTLHPRTAYSWYRWEHFWNPPAEGKYTIMCRATNADGVTQPMEFPNPWDGRGYGNNMVFPYDVEVRS